MLFRRPRFRSFVRSFGRLLGVVPLTALVVACSGGSRGNGPAHDDAADSGGNPLSTGQCPAASTVGSSLGLQLVLVDTIPDQPILVCDYGPKAPYQTVTLRYSASSQDAFAAEWAPSMNTVSVRQTAS